MIVSRQQGAAPIVSRRPGPRWPPPIGRSPRRIFLPASRDGRTGCSTSDLLSACTARFRKQPPAAWKIPPAGHLGDHEREYALSVPEFLRNATACDRPRNIRPEREHARPLRYDEQAGVSPGRRTGRPTMRTGWSRPGFLCASASPLTLGELLRSIPGTITIGLRSLVIRHRSSVDYEHE